MIKGLSILAVVIARENSKRFKKKNIFPLNNKPLITYTIKEAKKSKYIDRLILSSESKLIIKIAKQNKWSDYLLIAINSKELCIF